MKLSFAGSLLSVCSVSLLVGCGAHRPESGTISPSGFVTGVVHGGQQPVGSAVIQLYAVGTTADASAATRLLRAAVKTKIDGSFDITNLYSCEGATEVYITATGGNPAPSTANPNLALMTALGPCSGLSSHSVIEINELTTVAAVYSLAPFMSSYKNIGSASSDAAALVSAFSLASQLVNTSTGLTPGVGVPSGESVPTQQIETIGDIVASCVNSAGGIAGDPSPCGQFFKLTTPARATAPQDTIQALLNLADNPSLNTDALYGLIGPAPPFASDDTSAPPDLRVRLLPLSSSGYLLQVGPGALSFPSTQTSLSASSQTVVLSNSGGSTISLGSPSVTGVDAGDFRQSSACGPSLAPGAACAISVSFTPQGVGTRSAYLSVSSSSPNSPQYVQLSGMGAPMPPSAPHAVVSDPRPFIPYQGASYDVTLSNTGTAILAIDDVSLATTNNTLTHNCGSSLPPGASCTASIHSNIPSLDQLTFATNDPDLAPLVMQTNADLSNPSNLPLADLFFPNTIIGNSVSQTATFPYVVAGYPTIAGTNGADFTMGPSCASQGIALGSNCTVTVTFTPSSSGLRTARINFAPIGLYIPLGGNGVATVPSPNVTLSEAKADFTDSLAPQVITLSNYGNSAVSIQSIAIQSLLGATEYSETNDCGPNLDAQSICKITLTSNRRIQGGTQVLLSISGDFGVFGVPASNHLDSFYDFGAALIGSTVPSTLDQIVGPGSTSGTLTGANPGDFTLTGCDVGHYDECYPNISFVPTTSGQRTAVATMTNIESLGDTPTASTVNYFLVGTGVSSATPGIAISPINIFAGALAATVSGTEFITVRNAGTTTLTSPSFTISGPDASNLSLPTPNYCDTSLTIGESCSPDIGYQSSQYAFNTATFTATDTASGESFSEPIYIFTEVGPPVSNTTINFPSTLQNDVSGPISITVTPAYRHAVATSSLSPFTATKANCAADEVPCVLTFVFVPAAAGNFESVASISDSYEGTGTEIRLTGNGTAPIVPGVAEVSPTSLTFPLRSINTTSVPMTVTLSNTGTGSFAISSLGFTGTDAGDFSLSTTCGGTVAPNANCTIDVTFAPTVAGAKSASLVVSGDSNAGLPIAVPITGSAQ